MLGSVLAGSPGLGLLLENLRQTVEGLGCRCISRQSRGNVPEPGSWSHLEVVGQPSSMGPARESRRAAGSWHDRGGDFLGPEIKGQGL